MKYSIIIPTYNHLEDCLKPCCESIKKYTEGDLEVLVVANGCTDGTKEYVESLGEPFKLVWSDKPLGYAGANNLGVKHAKGDYIVLLNNDVILLEQPKNQWLDKLEAPFKDPQCGISGPLLGFSDPAGHDFLVFFCVMIRKEIYERLGGLSEDYAPGGGEDTEFCIEAEKLGYKICSVGGQTQYNQEKGLIVGDFPVYHPGEATMNDIPKWKEIFEMNAIKLGKKYKSVWYRWKISNNCERAVFFDKDEIYPREKTRYEWAANIIVGKKVLEIGCSNGYGTRLLPQNIDYLGIDYDQTIIDEANQMYGDKNHKFKQADINKFKFGQYDTIIAFEVLEHLDNGKELAQELKKHCKCLLATMPYKEPVGFWGGHHRLHGLSEEDFPGFEVKYISFDGRLVDKPDMEYKIWVDGVPKSENLMILKWSSQQSQPEDATKQPSH